MGSEEFAISAAVNLASASRSSPASFDYRDIVYPGLLALVGYFLFVFHSGRLPLQIWDESRNAVNAVEMLHNGHWLIPTYDGLPDHWNTKPPLLLWLMAGLMKLGIPPLAAVRLPPQLAALATVLLAWATCRYALHDRNAGLLAGFLLFCPAFSAYHVGRTGDYDALMSLFSFCYILAFWQATERRGVIRIGWFAGACLAVVLAVMTKGIAGAMGLFGVGVFMLFSNRLLAALRDVRAWLLTAAMVCLCIGYYLLREHYDPGYLDAIWLSELGGRFLATNEAHWSGPGFYPAYLAARFQPAVILLPLTVATLLGANSHRRSLVAVCLSSGLCSLAVIMSAKTQLAWYVAPIIPPLALACAVGVVDALRWVEARRSRTTVHMSAAALAVILVAMTSVSLYRNQVLYTRTAREPANGQLWYGDLFDRLLAEGAGSPLVVIDHGISNAAGFANYNAVLRFYADVARDQGLVVNVVPPETQLSPGSRVATCDPAVKLAELPVTDLQKQNAWCSVGLLGASR